MTLDHGWWDRWVRNTYNTGRLDLLRRGHDYTVVNQEARESPSCPYMIPPVIMVIERTN